MIREKPLVISEESQGSREVLFFFFQRKKKMNSENYWVVSLTAISYKILEGIIKWIACQLLEMVITRNHAKLTLFFFLNAVF